MLPEVEEFLKVKEVADNVVKVAYAKSDENRPTTMAAYHTREYEKYREAIRIWESERYSQRSEASTEYNKTLTRARKVLLEKTTDPVIHWMLAECVGYESYIDTILPTLPTTRTALENLAAEHEWCGEFDAFMTRATKAGVMPPSDNPNEPDVSELVEWIGNRTDEFDRSIRPTVQHMVNQIVAKALADRETQNAAKQKETASV